MKKNRGNPAAVVAAHRRAIGEHRPPPLRQRDIPFAADLPPERFKYSFEHLFIIAAMTGMATVPFLLWWLSGAMNSTGTALTALPTGGNMKIPATTPPPLLMSTMAPPTKPAHAPLFSPPKLSAFAAQLNATFLKGIRLPEGEAFAAEVKGARTALAEKTQKDGVSYDNLIRTMFKKKQHRKDLALYWIVLQAIPPTIPPEELLGIILSPQHLALFVLRFPFVDFNARKDGTFNNTLLHYQIVNEMPMADLLIPHTNLALVDNLGHTPAHLAILVLNPKLAEKMLERGGFDLNRGDHKGNTMLHSAVALGLESTVQLLLEKGADPFVRNNEGQTALEYAAAQTKESLTALLHDYSMEARRDAGASENTLEDYNFTPEDIEAFFPELEFTDLGPNTSREQHALVLIANRHNVETIMNGEGPDYESLKQRLAERVQKKEIDLGKFTGTSILERSLQNIPNAIARLEAHLAKKATTTGCNYFTF